MSKCPDNKGIIISNKFYKNACLLAYKVRYLLHEAPEFFSKVTMV